MHKVIFLLFLLIISTKSPAQQSVPIYFKGAIKENKITLQRNIINKTIIKNLSLPLNNDTEENWTDAFWGMELLHYRSPWADGRINMAFDSVEHRSIFFQRALLELVYATYDSRYTKPVASLMNKVNDVKIYAMCVEYILRDSTNQLPAVSSERKKKLVKTKSDEAIARQLFSRLRKPQNQDACSNIEELIKPDFLKNYTILYSFQRKNRNFPGLAVIRDSAGNFVLNETGTVFSVPQLARSISNLPGYLTNGNTPQGIFRMYGFDTSKSNFIGPTTNIQLTMPFETSLQHFFNDSTVTDSVWTEGWYKKLLPGNLKNCTALYESFYAGKAGRTEIIAHGTTVDPQYYKDEIYYPQTPTMGCLCTKEIWSELDGIRLESDQEKLAGALQKAGGANGYCVVIEISDDQKAVSPEEVLLWINSSHER